MEICETDQVTSNSPTSQVIWQCEVSLRDKKCSSCRLAGAGSLYTGLSLEMYRIEEELGARHAVHLVFEQPRSSLGPSKRGASLQRGLLCSMTTPRLRRIGAHWLMLQPSTSPSHLFCSHNKMSTGPSPIISNHNASISADPERIVLRSHVPL